MDNQNQANNQNNDLNNQNQFNNQNFNQNNQNECNSKVGIGVVLALFGGLIGLIIGLLLYKDGTYERQTFIKGWLWTFVISMAVSIVIGVVFFAVFYGNMASYGFYY